MSNVRIAYETFEKTAPAAKAALLTMAKTADESGLDKALIELVKLRVSQINNCAFCLQIHLNASRRLGVPQEKLDLVAACVRARVDALVLTPTAGVPAQVERLAAGGLPVVLMDREGGSTALDRVVMDNYRCAFQATRLLIESGHRRIALVNGPSHVSTAAERLRGYGDALAFAGLPVVDEYVRAGPFSHEHGRQATLDLLALDTPPEAVFTSSVILTSGVLHALRERRLRWPDDIAIVGFGDAAWVPVVTPPLTVIEQPAQQLGEVAARLLLAHGGRERVGQRVVLDARLILRESHWRPSPALASGVEST